MTLVLIVEDNPINRDVLGRRLERRGFNIRFAEDGPTGIAAAKSLHARRDPDGHRPGRDGRLGSDPAHQGRSRDGARSRSSR